MAIISRFAPSPTGDLHLGHIFAAKVARDFASGAPRGKFLLRFEDIDRGRVKAESYDNIQEDLLWLGLSWDEEPLLQCKRLSAYTDALKKLYDLGFIYPCFCTRKEIQLEISHLQVAPHDQAAIIYPGTCRDLDSEFSQVRIDRGDSYSWRFNAVKAFKFHGELTFLDLKLGEIKVDPHKNGDVILARKDVNTSYHLAVVVDDDFQEITHITRGEDLLEATHVHRQLQYLLDLSTPVYFHHPLVYDENGKRLAKRNLALSIRQFRREGLSPDEVWDMLKKNRYLV